MSYDHTVGEIVTTFLLNTCRLRPQLRHAVDAVARCAEIANKHPVDKAETFDLIPLTTGSVAEFYIEPMLPHVGDIDVMFHNSTQLAIPREHPPVSYTHLTLPTILRV